MPKNVRNFWIELESSGKYGGKAIHCTPDFKICVRESEDYVAETRHLIIRGSSNDSGTLTLEIERKGLGRNPEMVCTQRFEIER